MTRTLRTPSPARARHRGVGAQGGEGIGARPVHGDEREHHDRRERARDRQDERPAAQPERAASHDRPLDEAEGQDRQCERDAPGAGSAGPTRRDRSAPGRARGTTGQWKRYTP